MNHDCPHCGEQLVQIDIFGRLASHQDGKILGEIYKCPNGVNQDGSCDSEHFSVAGSFYMYYQNETLEEGYPC